ncbi:hypothetical protein [Enterococcus faecalis]|uniref:hypothetical protein n=1 Tax=Enterococcus faecalis TaxID=1351 RepID=UPI0022F088BC|nr:hypothetical protein [Enterococcus faecalis]MCV6045309.1 hypothetical protein [Enterococcus faecalis]
MNSVIFEDIARIQAEKSKSEKKWIGYSVNAIIEALGMPRSKFWEYKAEHLN